MAPPADRSDDTFAPPCDTGGELRDGGVSARDGALSIRVATSDDLATIVEVGRSTYIEHFAHIWSASSLAEFLECSFGSRAVAAELQSSDTTYFLASADAAVVGFAKLCHPRAAPVLGEPGVELQKIYLRKREVGRGAGAALFEACLARAAELGPSLLWLHVLESNLGAQRFYLRRGFTVVGAEPFATADTGEGEKMLAMVRQLASR